MDLYNELQSSEAANPQLVKHFEDVMAALMTDVKKLDQENKKMEEKIIRYLPWLLKQLSLESFPICRNGIQKAIAFFSCRMPLTLPLDTLTPPLNSLYLKFIIMQYIRRRRHASHMTYRPASLLLLRQQVFLLSWFYLDFQLFWPYPMLLVHYLRMSQSQTPTN